MSIPYVLGEHQPFSCSPYLFSDKNKNTFFKRMMFDNAKPKIGLVWSGAIKLNESKYSNDRRNIDISYFKKFKFFENFEFYSLQKGEPAESLLKVCKKNGWNGPNIIDLTSYISDFSDTAALIDNLDLVISVDTSTAHLAGAMGKTVWLLNRYDTCWRWLDNNSEESILYPSIKIFRQPNHNYWETVIDKVFDELKNLQKSYI